MSLVKLISPEAKKNIDRVLAKFPEDQKRSAILEGLHILQDENGGFLTDDLQTALAEYLGVSKVDVYEVSTFYCMYDLKPVGRHKLNVCTNVSCMLNGAYELLNHVEKRLGVKPGETTKDGRITLKEVECQGACCGSPMLEVDKVFYENLTIEKVNQIIDSLE
ncbi:NAD(P)H-dependent oxidoreductase subunit E [Francisella sp. Scap27]|uniref:NADH-quinone oxidoreductase subunit NuoE family protein n=1 Tax=Francisella sp. Scap27 TaxID=2589986 RepID=UPI0015BF6C66|nr:NAD(P)H-dependent oxidoreductase subunit E [Francisella sp. Scap27]QLE79239.1 NAD(P)H-dependent oxidoreductase subunit E [Francisella sp. Scap27]